MDWQRTKERHIGTITQRKTHKNIHTKKDTIKTITLKKTQRKTHRHVERWTQTRHREKEITKRNGKLRN